jgi:hypothetical protein
MFLLDQLMTYSTLMNMCKMLEKINHSSKSLLELRLLLTLLNKVSMKSKEILVMLVSDSLKNALENSLMRIYKLLEICRIL